MATTPVRFEFNCQRSKLTFTHPLPSSLIASPQEQGPNYMEDFVSAITPIMNDHQSQCKTASASVCQACSEPATTVLQSPMSWLHNTTDPFISVWVNPVCGRETCELETRRNIQDMMRLIGGGGEAKDAAEAVEAQEPNETAQVMICKVCGKTEGVARCARCRAVAYCGKEHQRLDWKVHKNFCAHLAR